MWGSRTDIVVLRTGENYTDDGPDGPKIVHLGQYISNGSVFPSRVFYYTTDVLIDYRLVQSSSIVPPRSTSPITVSLDRRGYHRHIQL